MGYSFNWLYSFNRIYLNLLYCVFVCTGSPLPNDVDELVALWSPDIQYSILNINRPILISPRLRPRILLSDHVTLSSLSANEITSLRPALILRSNWWQHYEHKCTMTSANSKNNFHIATINISTPHACQGCLSYNIAGRFTVYLNASGDHIRTHQQCRYYLHIPFYTKELHFQDILYAVIINILVILAHSFGQNLY